MRARGLAGTRCRLRCRADERLPTSRPVVLRTLRAPPGPARGPLVLAGCDRRQLICTHPWSSAHAWEGGVRWGLVTGSGTRSGCCCLGLRAAGQAHPELEVDDSRRGGLDLLREGGARVHLLRDGVVHGG